MTLRAIIFDGRERVLRYTRWVEATTLVGFPHVEKSDPYRKLLVRKNLGPRDLGIHR